MCGESILWVHFMSSLGNKYILLAVDDVSKWVDTVALSKNEGRSVVQFFVGLTLRGLLLLMVVSILTIYIFHQP